MNSLFKIILYPFSFLYGLINSLRNWLYDRRIFKYTEFDIPVISVGNLTVGGTGKTPMVEYIIELLKSKYKIATLSRGYGRKTRGFILAGSQETAYTIGDEPFQFYKKYSDDIIVSVGEERILAVPRLLYTHPEVQVIILDDAFQHRALKPAFQILLNDYNRPFYNDLPMPSGRLREFSGGAKRADIVVVTKCPEEMSKEEVSLITEKIERMIGEKKKIFFSYMSYKTPVALNTELTSVPQDVIVVSGIANVAPLLTHIKKHYMLIRHFKFADHHYYTQRDIDKIVTFVQNQDKELTIITTEKDAVKLKPFFKDVAIPVFVLPIEVKFHDNEEDFQELVFEAATYKED
ncbi:MAG: tetraacyldisaccharide 4'-kinase [Candidatus Cyclobacteriaceae bacterium M2_1C_046]